MTREEFNIALDMALTKDRIALCLEYINQIESRTCDNCKFYQPETIKSILFKRCFFLGTVGDIITCGRWKQK